MGRALAVVLGLIVAACTESIGPVGSTLNGHVLRGPVTPVCQPDVPCEAPFSATFVVYRGVSIVGSFQSGTDGAFSVTLAPGTYTLRPAADAPIISPESQTRVVEVGPTTTSVELHFDTGLR